MVSMITIIAVAKTLDTWRDMMPCKAGIPLAYTSLSPAGKADWRTKSPDVTCLM